MVLVFSWWTWGGFEPPVQEVNGISATWVVDSNVPVSENQQNKSHG